MSNVINLKKQDVINLKKVDNNPLVHVCAGVNWGMVERKGLFGFGTKLEAVDLDLSIGLLDDRGQAVSEPVCYYNHFEQGITHSGDDQEGDVENDGLDNEVIVIDLSKVNPSVDHLPLVLNDFRKELENFGELPHLEVRIYEGTPTRVDRVIATFNIKDHANLSNAQALAIGNLRRNLDGSFDFEALGEPQPNTGLEALITKTFRIAKKH
ncbi:TerD family protein [Vibrio splendidus]|nr:TerD family protein [Vibrio splendidus]MCC4883100.1 TerD family protein [Vibrio splendidus]